MPVLKASAIALTVILAVELSQYVFSLGVFDVADVVANYGGVLVGYYLTNYIKSKNYSLILVDGVYHIVRDEADCSRTSAK